MISIFPAGFRLFSFQFPESPAEQMVNPFTAIAGFTFTGKAFWPGMRSFLARCS